MKVAFTALSSMSEILGPIRDGNNVTCIEIVKLHPDGIPYLGCFINACKSFGCSVAISKELQDSHGILEHCLDVVQIH